MKIMKLIKDFYSFSKGGVLEGKKDNSPIEVGDFVTPINFDDLTDKQERFLRSSKSFEVNEITTKGDTKFIDIGYNIPLKMSRFIKSDVAFEHKILFLQFEFGIDTHGEPDKLNFFKGVHHISELFPLLVDEQLPNTKVDFFNYSDIYRLKDGYYINNTNLKDYDFVFFGFMSKHSNTVVLILNYLDKHKVPHLTYETFGMYDTKSFGMELTESLGYDYIPSLLTVKLNKNVIKAVEEDFGFPLIVKDPGLDRGTGVFKIESMDELKDKFSGNNQMLMIQKMIPNDGDVRVITIKNKTELVVKRQVVAGSTEFRSNVALGGKAVKTTLPQNMIDMCEDISKHVPVCDILGFDILKDLDTGKYYVMEINISPHMATFCVVTGINLPAIIVKHIVDTIKEKK